MSGHRVARLPSREKGWLGEKRRKDDRAFPSRSTASNNVTFT